MVKGIEHASIASHDPHRLAQWYVEHLDFVVNYKSERSKTEFVKAPDGSMIEITEANPKPRPPQQTPSDVGLRHLAIAVTDFDAVYNRLKEKGVSFMGEPEGSKGIRLVYFSDGDGNILHLIQREKPM